MTKIMLCAVVISGFVFIGSSLSKTESKKIRTLYAIILFLDHTEKKIAYDRTSFDVISGSYVNKVKEADTFFKTLNDKNSEKTSDERLSDAIGIASLSENAAQELLRFADAIRKSDHAFLTEKIHNAKRVLQSEYESQIKEMGSKNRIYRSVSALIGVAAAIILY